MTSAYDKVVARLEAMPKQGESYDHKGRHGWANPIRSDTGALLRALVKSRYPSCILEIGTAHGLSGCYLARELPPQGVMYSIEWDEDRAKEAQANFDEAGLSVKVLCGDAMQVIDTLPDLKFGVVFLDANKDGYLEQTIKLKNQGRLAEGCIIIADNVTDRESELADFLAWAKEYDAVTIPTECGLLVVRI